MCFIYLFFILVTKKILRLNSASNTNKYSFNSYTNLSKQLNWIVDKIAYFNSNKSF